MSKFVKNLITNELSSRLDGVEDALLVNVIGMDANSTVTLRRQLREKNINILVIKNSLAARATRGTNLENAFAEMEGTLALVWGSEDIISLAKEVVALDKDAEFEAFKARGIAHAFGKEFVALLHGAFEAAGELGVGRIEAKDQAIEKAAALGGGTGEQAIACRR